MNKINLLNNDWVQIPLNGATDMIVAPSYNEVADIIWSDSSVDDDGIVLPLEGGRFNRNIYVRIASTFIEPATITIIRS